MKKISFKAASGALVPLESIVSFNETVGPQTVNHAGQLPAVTISFALRPGVALGAAVEHIQRVSSGLLPPTVTRTSRAPPRFQASLQNLGLLLVIAIGVVQSCSGCFMRAIFTR